MERTNFALKYLSAAMETGYMDGYRELVKAHKILAEHYKEAYGKKKCLVREG